MSMLKIQMFFAFALSILTPLAAMDRKFDKEQRNSAKRFLASGEGSQEQNKKHKTESAARSAIAFPMAPSPAVASQTAAAAAPRSSKWLTQPAQIVDLKRKKYLNPPVDVAWINNSPFVFLSEGAITGCPLTSFHANSNVNQLEQLIQNKPTLIGEINSMDRLVSVGQLLNYDANPNMYYHAPLLLQLAQNSTNEPDKQSLEKDKGFCETCSLEHNKKICPLEKSVDDGICADLLLEHGADTVIPEEGASAVPAIIYPHHTVYTYAVGKPGVLNAFKKRHEQIDIAVQACTNLCKDTGFIVAQYIIPIERGFTDKLHCAKPAEILATLQANKTNPVISRDELSKGLFTALALRHFTTDKTVKRNLTTIALALLTRDNANHTYTNDQHKQVGPALHIAVLSDKTDGGLYVDPQATQETTQLGSSSSAAAMQSVIQTLIAYGADETVQDAQHKTAKQHAENQYLKTPPLTRSNATAGSQRRLLRRDLSEN